MSFDAASIRKSKEYHIKLIKKKEGIHYVNQQQRNQEENTQPRRGDNKMMHPVPGYGTRWLVEQEPVTPFSKQDINSMRRYLEMLHKQGKFTFVQPCEIYEGRSEIGKKRECVGFCVKPGYGCGDTRDMLRDISEIMYENEEGTPVGKNTAYELETGDLIRIRLLAVNACKPYETKELKRMAHEFNVGISRNDNFYLDGVKEYCIKLIKKKEGK